MTRNRRNPPCANCGHPRGVHIPRKGFPQQLACVAARCRCKAFHNEGRKERSPMPTKKPGEAMSYKEAVHLVEILLRDNANPQATLHGTLGPKITEAVTICKNAAIECAARAER